MAIKIEVERWGGYKVSIVGARKSVKAKNIQEVHNAIDHYFRNHFHDEENCPLCREKQW